MDNTDKMIVNGREFKVYSLDSNRTIIERIAAMLQTTPKYLKLSFSPGGCSELDEEGNPDLSQCRRFDVVDVIKDIEELVKRGELLAISDLESRYDEWFAQRAHSNDSDSKVDLLRWFIRKFIDYHPKKALWSGLSALEYLNLQLLSEKGGREYDLELANDVERTKDSMLEEHRKQVHANLVKSREDEAQFKRLATIKEIKLNDTDFIIEKIKVSFTVHLKRSHSLLSLLNIAMVDRELTVGETELRVAVVAADSFFKINSAIDFSNFPASHPLKVDPREQSKVSGEHNNLMLIITNTSLKRDERKRKPEFIDILVRVGSGPNITELLVEFDLNVVPQNNIKDPNYDVSLKETLQTFIMDILVPNKEYEILKSDSGTKVKGSYYIINKYFQKELLLDAIMNDPLFSVPLFVDERTKVTKQQTRLYMYFKSNVTGLVSFSLLNQVVLSDNDPLLRLFKRGRIGTQYIKIRISSINNKNDIPFFKTQLNKLLSVFFTNERALFDIYKHYIKKFMLGGQGIVQDSECEPESELTKEGKPKKIVKFKGSTNTLAQQVPELFLPLYSRRCAKAPRIVSEEEAVEIEKTMQTMAYPVKGEGNIKPSIYSCDLHKTHPYPGLRMNKLKNADTFQYLPCCYATNQRDRKGSPYDNYFLGGAPVDKTDHELYKTARIVPNNIFGSLPPNIEKCFKDLLQDSKERYFRFGITYGPNSVIDCVARAVGSPDTRAGYIASLRSRMASDEFLGVSRQETFDLPLNLVKDWISDPSLYFDPKHFIRILEEFFDVSIFLFERSVGDCTLTRENGRLSLQFEYIGESVQRLSSGGQISIPNHSTVGSYLLKPLKDRVMFIYIHNGSDVDDKTHPQCETIVKFEHGFPQRAGSRSQQQLFARGSAEVSNIASMFRALTLQYEPVKSLDVSRADLRLEKQFIDKSGKTRLLYASWSKKTEAKTLEEFLSKSSLFTIITEPIAPLNIPIWYSTDSDGLCIPMLHKNSEAEITPLTVDLVNTVKETFNLTYHNASFNDYLCDASDYLMGYIGNVHVRIYVERREGKRRRSVRRRESRLEAYNKQRRLARVFFEFVMVQFARFLKTQGRAPLSVSSAMFWEMVVIDTNHSYVLPDVKIPYLSIFDSVFKDRDDKLIFTSDKLLQRVSYNVELTAFRKRSVVDAMADQNIAHSYFENVSDFEKGENYFILRDTEVFLSFVLKLRQGEILQNKLEPFQGSKFFSSEVIENGKIFSVRCFGNIDEAIKYQQKIAQTDSPGEILVFDPLAGFTRYLVESTRDIKIVAFKVESGAYFLTLNDMAY